MAYLRRSSLGNPEWALSGGMAVETPIDENFAFRGIVNYRWQSKSGSPKSLELTNGVGDPAKPSAGRSEEHTSELQSLMRISYAVFCLKKKTKHYYRSNNPHTLSHTKYNLQH